MGLFAFGRFQRCFSFLDCIISHFYMLVKYALFGYIVT